MALSGQMQMYNIRSVVWRVSGKHYGSIAIEMKGRIVMTSHGHKLYCRCYVGNSIVCKMFKEDSSLSCKVVNV